jgi:beta-galactosidase
MSDGITRRDFLTQAAMTSALALAHPVQAAPNDAHAREPLQRKASFDEDWKFSRGDFPDAHLPQFADGGWTTLHAPHDWSIAGPYGKDEPCGGPGGYVPTGIGWYRKSFRLPSHPSKAITNRRVSVLFDGVYQRSEVWINGHSLGMRPYGYIGFSYNLTPYLRPDAQPNVIAVRVDNSLQPNSRWYSGSGIYRHVWLVVTDPLHISQWGTTIRALQVTGKHAELVITTRIRNEYERAGSCVLTTDIVDNSGKTIQTDKVQASIPAGGEHLFEQRYAVDQPDLWSVSAPRLYRAQQSLSRDGVKIDAQVTPFGIRDARFDVDEGFLLNGERIKLNGVCLHGDGGAVGAAVPERIWERRLSLLKEMGCNAIRCSHNPPAPEFLDLCDTMGFLVMAEAFDEWREGKYHTPQYGYHKYFDEWSARDLTDMIARDRNHPSIVIWSAGNEVPDQIAPRGVETSRKLIDILHSEDPTRPVTVACDHAYSEPVSASPEFLALQDVVGYNYVDRWRDRREKYYGIDRQKYPQRRFIGTESIGLGGARGVYDAGAGIAGPRSNMRIAVEQLQRFIQTYDYVSGDFIWTGIDYLGEANWPNKSSTAGVLDTCGFPKDGFFLYQSLWSSTPMIHLSPHWSWVGKEGDVIPVICYTNCDTVELFLNGKSLGVKGYDFPQMGMIDNYGKYPDRSKELQTTGDLHLAWDVVYQPGTLKAVGMKAGKVIKTAEVRTAGEPAAIRLTADRVQISNSRGDVSYVAVSIVDKDGLTVPTANALINFAMAGDGSILGVDNGQADSHESFLGNSRTTFNGLALVLVQSNGKVGRMRLTASAASLTGASVVIDAA